MRVVPFIWLRRKKTFPDTAKEARESLDFILTCAKNALDERDFLGVEAYYRFFERFSDDMKRLADELEILENFQRRKENVSKS